MRVDDSRSTSSEQALGQSCGQADLRYSIPMGGLLRRGDHASSVSSSRRSPPMALAGASTGPADFAKSKGGKMPADDPLLGHGRQIIIREDWLKLTEEPILEPGLPIVDPHHHLW